METATSEEVVWEKGEKKVVMEFMEADESVGEVQIGFGEGVERGDLVGELVSSSFSVLRKGRLGLREVADRFGSLVCSCLIRLLMVSPERI